MQNFRAKPTIADGRRARARRRRAWRARSPWRGCVLDPEMSVQAPPNLLPRRPPAAARRRHQRLGRHLAGHARLHQPRGALAAPRRAGASDRARAGFTLRARAADLSGASSTARAGRRRPRARAARAGRVASTGAWPIACRTTAGVAACVTCGRLPRDASAGPARHALDRALDGRELSVADALTLSAVTGRRSPRAGRGRRRAAPRGRSATTSPTSSTATSTSPTSASRTASSARSRATSAAEEGYFLAGRGGRAPRARGAATCGATEVCMQAGLAARA